MRLFITVLVVFTLAVPAFADYTYVMSEGMDFVDLGTATLIDHQTLLMTGGGGGLLSLYDHSYATIQGTAPYNQSTYPRGGIEQLDVTAYAHLAFSGGEVYEINIGADATAILSGGKINRLAATQVAWQYDYTLDPPVLVPNPHIEMIVKNWDYNTTSKILTGTWENNSLFNIQLVNISGYSPTIEDIKFTIIPEPATLLILGLGGLLLRRKRS